MLPSPACCSFLILPSAFGKSKKRKPRMHHPTEISNGVSVSFRTHSVPKLNRSKNNWTWNQKPRLRFKSSILTFESISPTEQLNDVNKCSVVELCSDHEFWNDDSNLKPASICNAHWRLGWSVSLSNMSVLSFSWRRFFSWLRRWGTWLDVGDVGGWWFEIHVREKCVG